MNWLTRKTVPDIREAEKPSRSPVALRLLRAVAAMCLLLAANAAAEVPVKITYQGNLRQNGFLVNGQRTMVFRVYNSSTAASELWTSPAYDVSLSTGVFRVVLEPAIADWENGTLWLEPEIDGHRMAPREELTASPYAVNSLLHSGKRYTTAASSPTAITPGDLWYDSSAGLLNYWNGAVWAPTSGSGVPGAHAFSHSAAGSDPVTALGTHTVSGYVSVSSSVSAGWFYGNGSGLSALDADAIVSGRLSGDRIGGVIVSTHVVDGSLQGQDIADNSVTRAKLNQSGCANGDILQLSGGQWVCGSGAAGGLETDPFSIHAQDTLQAGATFYVSSGTVVDLDVGNSLDVAGPARLQGGPGQAGLAVEATGNVAIGLASAAARLDVRGADTQAFSFAVSTGAAHQVVVSTSGNVGIGAEAPRARLEVSGGGGSGEYIMIFNSGSKLAAWLKNK